MKLLVSTLLLLTASAALAQNPSRASGPDLLVGPRVVVGPDLAVKDGCPVILTSATVEPHGSILPVSRETQGDGSLSLHFKNNSGKAMQSATITARLRVKTNVYALDASPIDFRFTFSGTQEANRDMDQLRWIPLPEHGYLFGVAQVTLDQVVFADGTTWTARGSDSCAVPVGALSPAAER